MEGSATMREKAVDMNGELKGLVRGMYMNDSIRELLFERECDALADELDAWRNGDLDPLAGVFDEKG